MKKYRIFFIAFAVLALTTLACQALSRVTEKNDFPPAPSVSNDSSTSTEEPNSIPDNTGNGNASDSEFPMTSDATNVINVGDGSVVYYTKMSLEDVMQFYRDQYTAKGYTENKLLTVVASGTFSMVFDGDPSGKQVVVQSVDLGNGSRTVAIRLE